MSKRADKANGEQNGPSRRRHYSRLRVCLSASEIDRTKWFWFAEAHVEDEEKQWMPLLGKRAETSRPALPVCASCGKPDADPVRKIDYWDFLKVTDDEFFRGYPPDEPKFYKPLLEAVRANGDQPESFSFWNQIRHTIDRRQFPQPLVRFIPREPADLTKETWKRYFQILEGLEILPEKGIKELYQPEDGHEKIEQLNEYRDKVREKNFPVLIEGSEKSENMFLYPPSVLLLAIPILDPRWGIPRLLATYILFIDCSILECDYCKAAEKIKYLAEVATFCDRLRATATEALTSSSRGQAIVGYLPGSKPTLFLTHPMLTRSDYRDVLSFQGDHTVGDIAKKIKEGAIPVSQLRHALKTTTPFLSSQDWGRVSSSESLSRRRQEAQRLVGWLKPLYAQPKHRAQFAEPPDSEDYGLDDTQIKWLRALLDTSLYDKPFLSSPRTSLAGGKGRFFWPLKPGIRFLLPWLALVGWLKKEVEDKVAGSDSFHSVVLNHFRPYCSLPSVFSALQHELLADEQGRRSGEDSVEYFGFAVRADFQQNADNLPSWRRRFRRARKNLLSDKSGGDLTAFLRDVIRCDYATPAQEVKRFSTSSGFPLFEPLLNDSGVFLDQFVLPAHEDDENGCEGTPPGVLIACTWERSAPETLRNRQDAESADPAVGAPADGSAGKRPRGPAEMFVFDHTTQEESVLWAAARDAGWQVEAGLPGSGTIGRKTQPECVGIMLHEESQTHSRDEFERRVLETTQRFPESAILLVRFSQGEPEGLPFAPKFHENAVGLWLRDTVKFLRPGSDEVDNLRIALKILRQHINDLVDAPDRDKLSTLQKRFHKQRAAAAALNIPQTDAK